MDSVVHSGGVVAGPRQAWPRRAASDALVRREGTGVFGSEWWDSLEGSSIVWRREALVLGSTQVKAVFAEDQIFFTRTPKRETIRIPNVVGPGVDGWENISYGKRA